MYLPSQHLNIYRVLTFGFGKWFWYSIGPLMVAIKIDLKTIETFHLIETLFDLHIQCAQPYPCNMCLWKCDVVLTNVVSKMSVQIEQVNIKVFRQWKYDVFSRQFWKVQQSTAFQFIPFNIQMKIEFFPHKSNADR